MEIIKKLYSHKIILFTLALIINSCGIYVQYDYDSDVDFNNYSSYSFYEPDIEKVEISDLDKKRILRSLDSGLKSKGLQRSNSPDLLMPLPYIKSNSTILNGGETLFLTTFTLVLLPII